MLGQPSEFDRALYAAIARAVTPSAARRQNPSP
jgi:hypothetical protein